MKPKPMSAIAATLPLTITIMRGGSVVRPVVPVLTQGTARLRAVPAEEASTGPPASPYRADNSASGRRNYRRRRSKWSAGHRSPGSTFDGPSHALGPRQPATRPNRGEPQCRSAPADGATIAAPCSRLSTATTHAIQPPTGRDVRPDTAVHLMFQPIVRAMLHGGD